MDENNNNPAQAALRAQFERMIAELHGVTPAQLMVDFLYEMAAQQGRSAINLQKVNENAASIIDTLIYG